MVLGGPTQNRAVPAVRTNSYSCGTSGALRAAVPAVRTNNRQIVSTQGCSPHTFFARRALPVSTSPPKSPHPSVMSPVSRVSIPAGNANVVPLFRGEGPFVFQGRIHGGRPRTAPSTRTPPAPSGLQVNPARSSSIASASRSRSVILSCLEGSNVGKACVFTGRSSLPEVSQRSPSTTQRKLVVRGLLVRSGRNKAGEGGRGAAAV